MKAEKCIQEYQEAMREFDKEPSVKNEDRFEKARMSIEKWRSNEFKTAREEVKKGDEK